ncbi:very-long-chain 3-ketoacyl-CoA synthase [Aureococcus anophagefferens]|nr:very-long-chain 3-ketoacyl-CoA synthase [Aureococcus anophagefferens]
MAELYAWLPSLSQIKSDLTFARRGVQERQKFCGNRNSAPSPARRRGPLSPPSPPPARERPRAPSLRPTARLAAARDPQTIRSAADFDTSLRPWKDMTLHYYDMDCIEVFNGYTWSRTTALHWEYPLAAVALYVALIPVLKASIAEPVKIPRFALCWNLGLSLFSLCGLVACAPIATGLWFATMNYCVHSVMYAYFACMGVPHLRPKVKKFAIYITLLQLAQMVVGIFVTVRAVLYQAGGLDCRVNKTNSVLGLAMYSSYFLLFGKLFFENYVLTRSKAKAA